jgi:hypothetical protein
MPAEDRDRLFENALARHLRAEAAARDSACLDTELLAAYRERMLSPEEMSAAKDHLVSCARCQEVLTQLEATQNIRDSQNREPDLVATGAATHSNIAGVFDEAPAAPTSVPGTQKPQVKLKHFPARKSSLLRWAAPAGAIAAGLLLWIGVRELRTRPKAVMESTQIADNRRESSRSFDVPPAAPVPLEKQKSERSEGEEYRMRQAVPPLDALRDEMKASRSAAAPAPSKKSPAAAPLGAPKVLPGTTQTGAAGASADADSAKLSAKSEKVGATSHISSLDSAQSRVDLQQNEMKPQAVDGARPAPTPPPPSDAKERPSQIVTAEGMASVSPSKDANVPALSRAVYNLAALPSVVTAPGGKTIWRFGEHGSVARSTDAGRTWESQATGVTATLMNGSAPSEKTCWIAGAGGTLLRTVDGGKHWQVIATPISGDLGGVRATDAEHATIWGLSNRVSFETSDGGSTWKQTANQ